MDWEVFYQRFREPDFVPGYEIQNRLGGGAFGEVFKARKHSIGKPYAIKFLKLDDEAQREAVERELEQVRHFAAIDHPNLVTIEDMGTVLGVPYLIMGYAGEETLARRLRERPLARPEALSIFVQVARGVLALHDRRLVHFDLKPGNVFLKGEVARVGDYGLSKLMSSGRMTLSIGRGTPHYMAPEILRSRADHRADIYSLGVILYECLAGKVPFEAATPGGLVMRDAARPPEFAEDFPADLATIVARCLEVEPDARYASLEELLEALGQTARPGDSIRLEARPAPAAVEPPAPTNGSAPAREEVTELRSTAAELARGAKEVARGVWDGLRSTRDAGGAARQGSSGRRTPPPVPVAHRGAPPGSAEHPTPPPLPVAPAESGVEAPGPAPPASPARAPAAGTIPVPPRAAGGAWGALSTALAVGLEVLGSIVVGLWSVIARGFGYARGRAELGGGGVLRRLARLLVILVVLALVGGAILAVLMAVTSG